MKSLVERRAKVIVLVLIICILQLFLSSCATLSLGEPKSSSDCILIIPVRTTKNTSGSFFGRYIIAFSNTKSRIVLNPSVCNRIVKNLEPGENLIESVQFFYKRGSDRGKKHNLYNKKFTLKPGYITVLPYLFEIELYKEGGFTWQEWDLRTLSFKEKEEIWDELSKDENFALWKNDFFK